MALQRAIFPVKIFRSLSICCDSFFFRAEMSQVDLFFIYLNLRAPSVFSWPIRNANCATRVVSLHRLIAGILSRSRWADIFYVIFMPSAILMICQHAFRHSKESQSNQPGRCKNAAFTFTRKDNVAVSIGGYFWSKNSRWNVLFRPIPRDRPSDRFHSTDATDLVKSFVARNWLPMFDTLHFSHVRNLLACLVRAPSGLEPGRLPAAYGRMCH